MKRVSKSGLSVLLSVVSFGCFASDACSTRAIVTDADVTASDGSTFRTESYFQGPDTVAIRHHGESEQWVVVEGPFSWSRVGSREQQGSVFERSFAFGHQFHAYLLYFDELVENARESESVNFAGVPRRARSGDNPYGGTTHLVEGAVGEVPAGLVFELPESLRITVTFSDWREVDGRHLPYLASIDDGQGVFEYRFSLIQTHDRSSSWFSETVGTPALDGVQVYRLHRELLLAHCQGDADRMANLSSSQVLSANNGEVQLVTNAALRQQFEQLFGQLDYTAYHDLRPPQIELAASGDLGWIAANVRAVALAKESGAVFDSQWAWIMTVRKVEGRWLHTGTASNLAH